MALAQQITHDSGKGAWVSLNELGDGTYTVWLHYVGVDEFLSREHYEQWRNWDDEGAANV